MVQHKITEDKPNPLSDPIAERDLLSALIYQPELIGSVSITPGDFGDPDYRPILRALQRLHAEGIPPEVTHLASELQSFDAAPGVSAYDAVGGTSTLGPLCRAAIENGPIHAIHFKFNADKVREAGQRRRIVEYGQRVADIASNGLPTADVLEFIREQSQAITTTATGTAAPAFTNVMSCAELLALDLHVDFLVDGILVRGQPGVIGGRSKTLKSSMLVDLVLSLGTGQPFLGQFATKRATTAYWSGESGAATIRAKARAVAAARGFALGDADVFWSFDLPKLARADHLSAIADVITKRNIDVAIIDPLYLSLLDASTAGQASNVFAMGNALQPLSELTAATGCTILLCHHFRKSAGDPDEPAALEELSQAGVGEWARQWMLLARRSPYQADGRHDLWLRAGGSAGHAGLYALDVDEGDPAGFESEGRRWDVTVRSVADARDETRRAAEDRKAEQQAQRDEDDRRKMLEALRRTPDGDTVKALRQLAGLSNERAANALRSLVGEGRAEGCEIKKYRRTETGYRHTEI